MRLGAALGAVRHGVRMVHQRVPLRYVDEEWERDREIRNENRPKTYFVPWCSNAEGVCEGAC